jgi:hypothetical protein
MKQLSILFICALIAGCSWTPERTNPFDPSSDLYIPPPIPNRAPVITGLVINTDCVNGSTEDECGITLRARVSDVDNNLVARDVIATVDDRFFGRLAFFPVDSQWALTVQESELDSAIETFSGSLVMLSVIDDSGATDHDTLRFPSPFRDYPEVHWPTSSFNCLCPDYDDLSWSRWTGEGHPREFEVRFYYKGYEYASSLTINGISPNDTTVVADGDYQPADSNGTRFYSWRVFVYDQLGNSAGSAPGAFRYLENCTSDCIPPN